MSSPYIIRHSLSYLRQELREQISHIEKTHNLLRYTPQLPYTQIIINDLPKEFDKLETLVRRYKSIEMAMEITHYTELPIQK